MLFNSIEFVVFLPLVFFLYWFVCARNLNVQNLLIVAASYLFYGWWNWHFLLLIAFTTVASFVSGRMIAHAQSRQESLDMSLVAWYKNKAWLIAAGNVLLNLGILGYYKYCNFFIDSFVDAFQLFGVPFEAKRLDLILPVGISFYTFQALSYTIDIYRKKIEATRDVVSFFAYISFFPQLVAGPIERATNLLPQFRVERVFSYPKAVDGMRQILWGLFKKMVVADNCARLVNAVYDTYTDQPASVLAIAAVCFSVQIYCDFSGYSDIAIGTARLFGFDLMRNFNYPYFSRDMAEFWRRWHISLSTWFRDYVYIPLGGSRGSRWQSLRNTLILFLVSGFWHGANFTFIAWGLFHGLLFIPLLLSDKNRRYKDVPAAGRLLPSISEFFSICSTFLLATVGWILFRSATITEAVCYIERMCTTSWLEIPHDLGLSIIVPSVFVLFVVEWLQRDKNHALQIDRLPTWNRYLVYYLLLALCLFYSPSDNVEFIYFQF